MDLTVLIPVISTALVGLITAITTAVVKIKKSTDKKIIELKIRIENLERINSDLKKQNQVLKDELDNLKKEKITV